VDARIRTFRPEFRARSSGWPVGTPRSGAGYARAPGRAATWVGDHAAVGFARLLLALIPDHDDVSVAVRVILDGVALSLSAACLDIPIPSGLIDSCSRPMSV